MFTRFSGTLGSDWTVVTFCGQIKFSAKLTTVISTQLNISCLFIYLCNKWDNVHSDILMY